MRNMLLASVFALGAVGTVGSAIAQTRPAAAPAPLTGAAGGYVGQSVAPAPVEMAPWNPMTGQLIAKPGSYVGANNNNNAFGTARSGPSGNPTPGTMVIHLNGRVTVQYYQGFNSLSSSVPGNSTGSSAMSSWLRLYPGMDAMAANGLRYGAAVEIRQNAGAPANSGAVNANSNGGGHSTTQTLYNRRAFVYLGTNELGIIRAGLGDGLISLFDQGRTTMQTFSPTSSFNGSDLSTAIGGNSAAPWIFMSGSGDEYDTQKIVYLSPNFSGFDFGLQYSPNAFSNLNGCGAPATTCANLQTSGTALDGQRYTNMIAAGVRYSGPIGPVSLHTYGVYTYAGHVNYSGTAAGARAAVGAPGGSTWNGQFDNLNYGSMGAALTYAGVTVGGNFITGAINGRGATKPSGGANANAFITGIQYATGPMTIGMSYEYIDSQGAVALAGLTQRKEYAFNVGGSYSLAPGLVLFADYIYQNRKQSGWNFLTATAGSAANNQVQGQGFVFGTQVSW